MDIVTYPPFKSGLLGPTPYMPFLSCKLDQYLLLLSLSRQCLLRRRQKLPIFLDTKEKHVFRFPDKSRRDKTHNDLFGEVKVKGRETKHMDGSWMDEHIQRRNQSVGFNTKAPVKKLISWSIIKYIYIQLLVKLLSYILFPIDKYLYLWFIIGQQGSFTLDFFFIYIFLTFCESSNGK